MNFHYPGDQVVDVVEHISSGVDRVASLPVVSVAFEEQMSESHEVFLFERDHHLIAQTKRHQLFWKIRKKQNMKQTFGDVNDSDMTAYLDRDDCDFQYLQHQFPRFSPSGSVLLTRIHEVILEPAPEILHPLGVQTGGAPWSASDQPPGLWSSGQQGFGLLHGEQTAERSLQFKSSTIPVILMFIKLVLPPACIFLPFTG